MNAAAQVFLKVVVLLGLSISAQAAPTFQIVCAANKPGVDVAQNLSEQIKAIRGVFEVSIPVSVPETPDTLGMVCVTVQHF